LRDEDKLGIYLYKNSAAHEKEDYSISCTFGTKNIKLDPLEKTSSEMSGYGYGELVTVQDLFDGTNFFIDIDDNCFTIDIEVYG
jgi:hypothetical protein